MSYFIFLVGMVNYYLLTISRNITFFYVFIACIISGYILLFEKPKFSKIVSLLSVLSFVILSAISLYYHFLYNGVMNDYLILLAECVILSLLTAISILPIKIKKSPAQ